MEHCRLGTDRYSARPMQAQALVMCDRPSTRPLIQAVVIWCPIFRGHQKMDYACSLGALQPQLVCADFVNGSSVGDIASGNFMGAIKRPTVLTMVALRAADVDYSH